MKVVAIAYPGETFDLERRAVEDAGSIFCERFRDGDTVDITDANVVVNTPGMKFTCEMLDSAPGCSAVVGYGIGVDWIDIDDASRRGIFVINTPWANVVDVAIHTVAMILACHRRLHVYSSHVRAGVFDATSVGALRRTWEESVGFLAFGRIPRRVCEFLRPFGFNLQAYDPYVDQRVFLASGVQRVGLDELVETSNYLSVHLPLTAFTRKFIGEALLAKMPKGASLIVTSRGGVYDLDAVVEFLERGHLACAALDVFPEEPLPVTHRVTSLHNVILTPHAAGYSEEALWASRREVARALRELCLGRVPETAVNAAEALATRAGAESLCR